MTRLALASLLVTLAAAPASAALAPLAPFPAPQEAIPDEALRLVPGDAVFVLRLESVDAVVALANAFASIGEGKSMDAADLIGGLDLPGDTGQVDASRPLLLAVSVNPQMPAPMVTQVLPVRDPQAYLSSLGEAGPWAAAALGSYVGVSQVQGFAPAAAPSPLAAGLRPGLASMRLDLASLIAAFRPLIEMGLEQVELQMDQIAQLADGPMDVGPLLEMYVDLVWDFIDSAEQLDAALAMRDGSLELYGSLATREGSSMAAWGGGEPVDLRGWPPLLEGDASLAMAMGGDWAAMMERMGPFLDASLAIYPEEMQTFFDDYLKALEPLYPAMGSAAMAGDFGASGMRFGYVLRSGEPERLLDAMLGVAQRFGGGEGTMGISLSAPEAVELDGVQAHRFRMDIDYDALVASMGAELGEADREQMRDAMAAIYGPDGLTVTLASRGKALVSAFGGDEAFARSVVAGAADEARPVPADLQRALAAASGGSTALVYRFDLGRLMEQFGGMAAAMNLGEAGLDELPTSPLAITWWGSIRGREWNSGLALDQDQLVGFVSELVDRRLAQAHQAVVRMDIDTITSALQAYAANNGGRHPDSLDVLTTPDENGAAYLNVLPLDPWGNPYAYEPPTAARPARIVSYGRDGVPGGEGPDADIVNASAR